MRILLTAALLLSGSVAHADELVSRTKARSCALDTALVQAMMVRVNKARDLDDWVKSVVDAAPTSERIHNLAADVWLNRKDPNYTMRHYDQCMATR